MPSCTLITNHANGAGLERDARLLRGIFEVKGWQVRDHQFNAQYMPNKSDWIIFIETYIPHWTQQANFKILLPNPEWFHPSMTSALRHIDQIWCKTYDSLKLFQRLAGVEKCIYIGFEANDLYLPHIPKQRKFLHVAGKSIAKGTEQVIQAWRSGLTAPLTIVSYDLFLPDSGRGHPSITSLDRVDDIILQILLNTHRFVIQPSWMEGYGHVLHEALSCAATVLTTDAAPMNEYSGIDKRFLLPVHNKIPRFETWFHHVDPNAMRQVVEFAMNLPEEELDAIGEQARAAFLTDREEFRRTMKEIIPDGIS